MGDRESGWVLPMVGLLIVPLIIMTAFAVDVGAWYAQAAKLQRASDNAALAGVVWMPDRVKARTVAQESLRRSGYSPDQFTLSFPTDQHMEVSGTQRGTRYFSGVFMNGQQSLTRSGTATFNRPVELGSPTNTVGNNLENCTPTFQPLPSGTGACASQPLLWQAIQAPYEGHQWGDPFATFCAGAANCTGQTGSNNPEYRPNGYEFAVDVPASSVGTPISVQIWDAASIVRTTTSSGDCPASANYLFCQTGDGGSSTGTMRNDRNSVTIQYQLFENDGSDLTVSFDTPKSGCELYIPRRPTTGTANSYGDVANYKNKWYTLCTFTPDKPGIYPMRVKTSNIIRPSGTVVNSPTGSPGSPVPGDKEVGWNSYALRATGAPAKLYNLGAIGMWTNTPGSTARFYLANVTGEHRGKKIVLDMFDAGDGSDSNNYSMQVLAPPGSSPYNVPAVGAPLVRPAHGRVISATGLAGVATSCRVTNNNSTGNRGSTTQGGGTPADAVNCEVRTKTGSNQHYNNQWLRFEIVLDPNYSCDVDCWWTIKYDFGGGTPYDRTTWTMQVVGDPVHLTE